MDHDSVDAAIAAAGHRFSYAGLWAYLLGWLASIDVVSVVGLSIAVLGYLTNLFFKIRDDRRKQILLEAQLRQIGKAE